MDAIRKLKATVVEEVHKDCDPEVGDRLQNMRRGLAFFAACMVYNSLRLFLVAIPTSPPYVVQDRKVRLLVVTALVALLAWLGSMMLILTELPMKKRAWSRIYHWMVYLGIISFMVALKFIYRHPPPLVEPQS